ncbi:hypothetical protein BG262_09090 [Floricoccus penangensis]|uniref:DNA polymerase III polC-type n=1 Tax=Floricoccus penangensis TaxID=1859475 RepID=A0A9Q5JHH1_9LACT|nr:helicase C-terminal domain-containing protein [Floricoccus penangensis]OFI47603.1 hypothetical protein BG262_09090 [Floricoccus penangensis]
MTKFAVVDLEATDAHLSQNKIIQVGIVILDGEKVIQKYSSNVNPHEELAPIISELTGLTDEVLSVAPDFSEIAEEISLMLEGTVFVAHNVKFDYNLLKKSLNECGIDFDLPSIDTVELSRVFFPDFEKYSLEYLSEKLDLTHDNPHEAFSDAYATAKLLIQIQNKIKSLPRVVVGEILRHAGNLIYETQLVIKEIFDQMDENINGYIIRQNIATKKVSFEEENRNLSKTFEENMERINLSVREKQAKVVSIFEDKLDNPKVSFIQAQTGVGKTYAYLLGLLEQDKKIVISTSTKVLQEQIMVNHAKEFREEFGINISKFLGFKNYIKIEEFVKTLPNTQSGINQEIFKMKVLVWLCQTETGELSELSPIMTSQDYLNEIAHDGNYNQLSMFFEQDFLRLAHQKLQHSSAVVINHALMVEKMKNEPEFFAERVLVVDETQQLFGVLESVQEETIDLEFLNDELALIDSFTSSQPESNLKKRLKESLNYHINYLPDSKSKVLLDAEELGLKDLVDFLSNTDESFLWKTDNILHKSPKDFLDFAHLNPQYLKTFLIGATLSMSDSDRRIPELLGFEDYTFDELPSSQAHNQEILIATDGPNIGNMSNTTFAEYIKDNLLDLAEFDMPILVLLTAKDLLKKTSELLMQNGVNHLAQGIHGTPSQIKKRFDDGKSQILLGLNSFWEGVDFDKQDEIIVVIPRLPFSTPDDILIKKYAERFDNPFYDFNVPMTTLRLRQALGRVNRRPEQKSAIVILDKRIAGKNYGKKMTASLVEAAPIIFDEINGIKRQIVNFLV